MLLLAFMEASWLVQFNSTPLTDLFAASKSKKRSIQYGNRKFGTSALVLSTIFAHGNSNSGIRQRDRGIAQAEKSEQGRKYSGHEIKKSRRPNNIPVDEQIICRKRYQRTARKISSGD